MDRSLIWPAAVVALVLVVGFVALAGTGHDTSSFVVFVSGPLVSSLVGLVLARKVGAVAAVTEVVAHQTNSLLSDKLAHIDSALDEAKTDRAAIAAITATPPVPNDDVPKLVG